ncbi:uncharacterized protein PGTG_21605 [Puccinia graminis f. sp. tritici CRL 75-36-700-3]|uniref:Uncharacterized protein n=1 Tax=Puccinia graminis f. sp. tritici (strain CRL 75-36-700-3 / race SCCL) TaxID=418459 RepID=H6QS29_PUCGT|nr:uncharacterized protein PGTG_21605 [Puccinia graminis f. sp. tritici CRL 75-36-700-3]EHS63475.1 hypothetical protein PGTG_21605 [Puccinia graminis f. sp. tritici CRL 75-36-700-3]
MRAWMYTLPLLLTTLLPGCTTGLPMQAPEHLSQQATELVAPAKCPECKKSTKREHYDRLRQGGVLLARIRPLEKMLRRSLSHSLPCGHAS